MPVDVVPAFSLALAAVAAAGGLGIAAKLRAERPTPSVEIDGLQLRLERASWVDRDPVSPSGTGLDAISSRRLALTLLLRNATRSEQRFAWSDLVLRAGDATSLRLSGGEVAMPAGHAVLLDASLDVREPDAVLALWWERGAARERLLVTRTPRQVGRADGPPARWPLAVTALPAGRSAAGGRLFHGRLACASCHGDPAAPDAGGPGPPLGAVGAEAGLRQRDRSAAQYLYESLLDPSAFLSPACAGHPCGRVQMPAYGESMSLQDAADLVAYLLAQRAANP